jgi:hypothetical protein
MYRPVERAPSLSALDRELAADKDERSARELSPMECFRLPYVSGMSVLHTPPSTKNTANMAFHPMFLGRTYGCPTTIVCTILFKKNSSRLCTVSSFVLWHADLL